MDINSELKVIVQQLKQKGANRVYLSKQEGKPLTLLVSAMEPKEYYLIRSEVFIKFKNTVNMYCEITNPLKYHEYVNSGDSEEII